MKHPAAVLLAILLLAGVASALAVNPGSVGAVKTISPAPSYQVAKVPVSTGPTRIPVTIGTYSTVPIATGQFFANSVPQGASITVDGNTYSEKTPAGYFTIAAGTHTVVLSLGGYQDFSETFTLHRTEQKYINVSLMKLIPGVPPSAHLEMGAKGTFRPGPGPTFVVDHQAVTRVTTTVPVPVTTTPPPPVACKNSDWTCLTPEEAQQQFGSIMARYGDEACGWLLTDNGFVAKYCYIGGATIPASVLQMEGIRENDNIYIENGTFIRHAIVKKSPGAGEGEGSGNVNPIQSFFDIFINFFWPKPSAHLEFIELNPQPSSMVPTDTGRA